MNYLPKTSFSFMLGLLLSFVFNSCGKKSYPTHDLNPSQKGPANHTSSQDPLIPINQNATNYVSSQSSVQLGVVINQNSTATFLPVSIDARYGDCGGSILYNVTIKGDNASSIGVQSQVRPQLNRWYTANNSTTSLNRPGQRPSLFSDGITAPSLDPIFSDAITFTAADSEHLAFIFQISYKNGRQLNGTVDVPLTPGRQVRCN